VQVTEASSDQHWDPDLGIDITVAHPARVYDYWLGGKDNFAPDRVAGDRVLAVTPGLRYRVRANRAFLGRTVRYLAAEAGVRQFLDLGTGIPSADNTHEVAQRVAPQARVVYVDNDPIVLRHAQALLRSAPGGVTTYIEADLRDPQPILRQAAATLDFSQPVAVMLLGVLHLVSDAEDPWRIVTELMAAVSPGSYLVISHPPSTSAKRRPKDSASTTRTSLRHRRCGPATRSPGSSPGWNSCRRASSRCTSGARTRKTTLPRGPSPRMAVSGGRPANPSPRLE
jgi:hypothetical protein